ncbi:MAG: SCP2 sterol-binding domain-containing protein [Acidimicrobiales bacterium]
MAAFLSSEWFAQINQTLGAAGTIPLEGTPSIFRVVIEFPDSPGDVAHAMTLTMQSEGASVSPGDHLAADALVTLSYDDALALTSGEFDSATALREGRVKVRGDINLIVPLLAWLAAAHPRADG